MRQIGILVVSIAWHAESILCAAVPPPLLGAALGSVHPYLRLAATKRAASVTAERWTGCR